MAYRIAVAMIIFLPTLICPKSNSMAVQSAWASTDVLEEHTSVVPLQTSWECGNIISALISRAGIIAQ